MSTKRMILDYTIGLIKDEGVKKVSGRRVCQALGINVSSIKYHFGDKESLIREALQEMTGKEFTFYKVLIDTDLELHDRLYMFIVNLYDFIKANQDLVKFMLQGKSFYPLSSEQLKDHDLANFLIGEFKKERKDYSHQLLRMKILQLVSAIAYPMDLHLMNEQSEEELDIYLKSLMDIFI